MNDHLQFYIDGTWMDPVTPRTHDVINPATQAAFARISLGSADDVDRAARAARKAFQPFSETSVEQRTALMERVLAEYMKRYEDIARTITLEIGAPAMLSKEGQAAAGVAHLKTAIAVLKQYRFEEVRATTRIVKLPIGVCGLITPWNWPMNQILCKVAPALAVGCTMVLKPSEITPVSAIILAEIMHAAGVPAGVFNLVNGDGAGVGAAIAGHPEIDLVSFTGSTRAGIAVAQAAAPTVKRVHQELGGKSANILLPDADFVPAVTGGIRALMANSGQSCNAPSRMLVPNARMHEALAIAKEAVAAITVGTPDSGSFMGPVASHAQWSKIQASIAQGIQEGATVIAGGPGKPAGLEAGFYVKPTILANVNNQMAVAREEIFGPVLVIIGYDTVEEAIAIANDTPYGLAAYVSGSDPALTRKVAARMRAGQVNINGAPRDFMAPFGGFKQSGNGREWGDVAFGEFLEFQALLGYEAALPA